MVSEKRKAYLKAYYVKNKAKINAVAKAYRESELGKITYEHYRESKRVKDIIVKSRKIYSESECGKAVAKVYKEKLLVKYPNYWVIHRWARELLSENDDICMICNESKDKLACANIGHQYKKNIKDWISVCYSCHILMDKLFKKNKLLHLT